MTKHSTTSAIRLRGVRHNNLKNFDLDIPIGRLTVITGLSGSGKSSLAFDTLFAEGQRRYIETFSPYARQFFDRMDKPQVDRIEGIPPAIAIEQRNAVRSTRSTVGTMTELCDYMKLLWPHVAELCCRGCGQPVRRDPPPFIWEKISREPSWIGKECLVTFDLALSEKLGWEESLQLVERQGYQRLLVKGSVVRLDEVATGLAPSERPSTLTVVQDRLTITDPHRARFVEACEQAYHFGRGRLALFNLAPSTRPENSGTRGTSMSVPKKGEASRAKSIPLTDPTRFSAGFHCATCDIDYREPTPALFSFNHPIGACAACKGFGRIISIDYERAIPDRSKTLAEGAVKPWQTETGSECQVDLAKACKRQRVPMDVPFNELSEEQQHWVIDGDAGYDSEDPAHSWPRKWYGVRGYFRWLESKAYKMHVRVLLSRYRAYTVCPDCRGQRLNPDALLYKLRRPPTIAGANSDNSLLPTDPKMSLASFYALSIEEALRVIEELAGRHSGRPTDPVGLALNEVRSRLLYLVEVGLDYLTLDRPTRTLSGGETERVNLTTCLGTRLVNTLFVLDEPSVGLHPRDTARLVRILEQLRDAGNTVVVVEHEASVMRAADQIVDLGPGQGEKGGQVVFCGPVDELLKAEQSLTGRYLSGRQRIESPERRPVGGSEPPGLVRSRASRVPVTVGSPSDSQLHEATVPYQATPSKPAVAAPVLRITNATRHNLKNLTVEIPLERFVCLAGVSGSGKTTLIREVLLPALQSRIKSDAPAMKASDRMESDDAGDEGAEGGGPSVARVEGWQHLDQVVLVDQSALGKTPRSNPIVYIGAFDDVRDLFAQTDLAKQRGLNGSAFSFNSGVGQCERCRGAGFEKIEMQFLSDVFIKCPECQGRRYRGHILEVKLRGPVARDGGEAKPGSPAPEVLENWSIADLLEATVDDSLTFLMNFIHVPAGRRALARLKLLQEVGLGYLRLGQPINTLSGGESQRLKLVSHLAESAATATPRGAAARLHARNTRAEVKDWLASKGALTPALSRGERAGRHAPLQRSDAPLPFGAVQREDDPGDGPRADVPPLPEGEGRGEGSPLRKGTLFLFDEPTTGLHFEDVRVLLKVFQRLVDAGHSVLVIEHNLDVIQCADWVIDLGPDAGMRGGQLVVSGTPEDVARCDSSHTGRFLRGVLERPEPVGRVPG